jgi:hypothetical protein
MKRFENTLGLVCLDCDDSPKVLINLQGLYYCDSCYDAHIRRDRWEKEEAAWTEQDVDNPPKV